MLDWLENWYLSNCNGDWEHDYGVKISTLDNPGWEVTIELIGTDLELPDEEWVYKENAENDWYGYKIVGNVFNASGDPKKLGFLISIFKNKIE